MASFSDECSRSTLLVSSSYQFAMTWYCITGRKLSRLIHPPNLLKVCCGNQADQCHSTSLVLRLRNCRVPRSHSRGWDGPVQGESRSVVPIAESKDRSYLKYVPKPLTILFSPTYPQPFPRILWRPLLHSSLLVLCHLILTTSKAGWRTQRNGSIPRIRMMSSGSLNCG